MRDIEVMFEQLEMSSGGYAQIWTHHPINLPDPIQAIKFRMEQEGLTVKDLEPIIGKSNRVYEVLNKTRPLSLNMIRNVHKHLGIGADVLIQAI